MAQPRHSPARRFRAPGDLLPWLEGRKLDAVVHLGAISSTTATDGDAVIETNFRLSLRLLDWCTSHANAVHLRLIRRDLLDGNQGFSDDSSLAALRRLKPLNLYD
jgi:ADP-L-glycero-D-manno-heptose 6-epimerase